MIKIVIRSPALMAVSAFAALFTIAAALLYFLYLESREVAFDILKERIGQLATVAALQIDGDLHRKVIERNEPDGPDYRAAVAPLVTFHNSLPSLFYVYTMVEQSGEAYFVLDTAGQPGLQVPHDLSPSALLEPFEAADGNAWLTLLVRDGTYVTPTFEVDDYGTFVSGHSLIRDADGVVTGFVGIDVVPDYFLERLGRLKIQYSAALFLAVLISAFVAICAYRLIAIIRADAKALEEASLTDALTGAWNRRAFEMRIESDFQRFKRNAVNISLMMIDADHFKAVNDRHGHDGGDWALKDLVGMLRQGLRIPDFVARFGGEEFVMILADTRSNEGMAIAERLRQDVEAHAIIMPRGGEAHITVSIGVSEFHMDDSNPDQIVARADQALYEAKANGRNRVVQKLDAPTDGAIAGPPDEAGPGC